MHENPVSKDLESSVCAAPSIPTQEGIEAMLGILGTEDRNLPQT